MLPSLYAYALVCLITAATPGPGLMSVLHQSMNRGFKQALPIMGGIQMGLLLVALIAGSGLGVLFTSSSWIYLGFKYLGASYIAYLGLRIAVESFRSDVFHEPTQYQKQGLMTGFLIACANPKTLIFFMVLFPIYVAPQHALAPQLFVLTLLLLLITLAVHCCFSLLAQWVSHQLKRHLVWFNRLNAIVFIAMAIALLLSPSPESGSH